MITETRTVTSRRRPGDGSAGSGSTRPPGDAPEQRREGRGDRRVEGHRRERPEHGQRGERRTSDRAPPLDVIPGGMGVPAGQDAVERGHTRPAMDLTDQHRDEELRGGREHCEAEERRGKPSPAVDHVVRSLDEPSLGGPPPRVNRRSLPARHRVVRSPRGQPHGRRRYPARADPRSCDPGALHPRVRPLQRALRPVHERIGSPAGPRARPRRRPRARHVGLGARPGARLRAPGRDPSTMVPPQTGRGRLPRRGRDFERRGVSRARAAAGGGSRPRRGRGARARSRFAAGLRRRPRDGRARPGLPRRREDGRGDPVLARAPAPVVRLLLERQPPLPDQQPPGRGGGGSRPAGDAGRR